MADFTPCHCTISLLICLSISLESNSSGRGCVSDSPLLFVLLSALRFPSVEGSDCFELPQNYKVLWSFSLALVTKLFSFKFRKNIIKEANLIRIPEITSSAAGKFVQLLYTSVACATAAWFLCQSFHRLRSPASCSPVAAKTRVGPPSWHGFNGS